MTKSDLRTGMVVEDENGAVGIVLKNTATVDGIKWFYNSSHNYIDLWEELDNKFNEDLTGISVTASIIKVYQPYDFSRYTTEKAFCTDYLIWERGDVKEITMQDIEEKFGCKVKIVG